MQTLRLANEDQTIVIDLLRAPFGIRAGFDFQTPAQSGAYTVEPYGAQFAFGAYDRHVEAFDITIRGRGAVVLSALDTLQDFIESIRLFHAGDLAAQSCWLEWSAHGEEPKRTLLYSGIFKATSADNITPGLEDCTIIGTLSLTRHALWETVAPVRLSAGGLYSLSALGGMYEYTGVVGNIPARIADTEITGAANLVRLWLGLRRFNQGTANFEPVWECENGTITDAADTALAGDGAPPDIASPGGGGNHRLRTTFATDATLISRFTITVDQVCTAAGHGDGEHFQGRYLVLARCQVVGASGVAGIQMRSGYTGNVISDEVYVDNTDWRLIPLGDISIPPWQGAGFAGAQFYTNYRIDIYAEELVTCDLDMDCFVLIPNEHMLTIDGASLNFMLRYVHALTLEDDTEVAHEDSGLPTVTYDSVEVAMTDWYFPQGSGCLVVAAERATSHALTDTIQPYLDYYPRWLLYRGV